MTAAEQGGFGWALERLKEGQLVARAGWNAKNMYLYLVRGGRFIVSRQPLLGILGEGEECEYRSHIDIRDAQGCHVPWSASQTDLLAEDWELVI